MAFQVNKKIVTCIILNRTCYIILGRQILSLWGFVLLWIFISVAGQCYKCSSPKATGATGAMLTQMCPKHNEAKITRVCSLVWFIRYDPVGFLAWKPWPLPRAFALQTLEDALPYRHSVLLCVPVVWHGLTSLGPPGIGTLAIGDNWMTGWVTPWRHHTACPDCVKVVGAGCW